MTGFAEIVTNTDSSGIGILQKADAYVRAGYSVIPVRIDGTKAPGVASWAEFQNRQPTKGELSAWFARPAGIAILCGSISGGLEVIDIDHESYVGQLHEAIQKGCPGLLSRLPRVSTPGGGEHIYYRCQHIEGNQKLTRSEITDRHGEVVLKTVIETRGEGGYVIAPGSPAECHPSNDTYKHVAGPSIAECPLITREERECIITAARGLSDPSITSRSQSSPRKTITAQGGRVGDDFNANASWDDVLTPHGWRRVKSDQSKHYWQRPGKIGGGWSATTGHCTSQSGNDLLYVFTSNAAPFEEQCCYSKFSAYGVLNHGGDFRGAAHELALRGYGNRRVNNRPSSTRGGTPTAGVDIQWKTIGEVIRCEGYETGIPAVSSSFQNIDAALGGGFRVGQIYIIASRTGNAKSQLAANIARRCAMAGVGTLCISLEDSIDLTSRRIHAAASKVPLQYLLDGIGGDQDIRGALLTALGQLDKSQIRIADCRDLEGILGTIRLHADSGGRLVIIDQLSKIYTPHLPSGTSTYERVNEISEALRLVASECRIPIVIICQVNREASKSRRELEVNDLRDSGMLEQDAAGVLLLNKPKDRGSYGGSPSTTKFLPVHIAKNRFGRSGENIDLLWYPRIGRIEQPEGAVQ